jgi:hypothetical protein
MIYEFYLITLACDLSIFRRCYMRVEMVFRASHVRVWAREDNATLRTDQTAIKKSDATFPRCNTTAINYDTSTT